MITVLRCRGVGEPINERQMLANASRLLDPKRFVVKDVPWEAQYAVVPNALGSSFDKALHDGRALLLKMIRDDPNPVVIIGYSGGSALAGNVAEEIGRGDFPMLDIRGVGLISDPLRPFGLSDTLVDPMARTWGVVRSRRVFSREFPVWYVADPSDVITCCPETSPLRTFADQSAAFSLVDPGAWTGDLIQRLIERRWQATIKDWRNVPSVWRTYSDALDGARSYLWGGSHTSYHIRKVPGTNRTYTEWLADRINSIQE